MPPKFDLEYEMTNITLTLYKTLSIPKCVVQFFVDTIIQFICFTYMNFLEEELSSASDDATKKVLKNLKQKVLESKRVLEKFDSEYKRFKIYQEKGLFTMPIEYEIGHRYKEKHIGSQEKTEKIPLHAHYMPLSWSFKVLLEIPGCFQILKNYISQLYNEANIISNFIQCDTWKKACVNFGKKFMIPIFIFQDDCEVGNALGTHAGKNKFGATYASIPCFPPYLASRLENIFLTMISYANDRKLCTDEKFYKKLIDELNHLNEHGLIINVDGKQYKIYFQLALALGDNLGLNEMLGFYESFKSGCPCRVCKATVEQMKNLFKDNVSLLRTVENYEEDFEQGAKSSGVTKLSIFNRVFGFHVYKNLTLDIMHDIFEGTANYCMVKILFELIFEKKLFSLEYLNQKIRAFNISAESSNKIPEIKKDHICIKKNLKCPLLK